MGLYTSLLYNVNVATTITSQGRSLVSSMCMQFEMFLNDNVQFGSINEVLQFIDNIVQEAPTRRYKDMVELDDYFAVKPQDVFYKICKNCTWRWVINEQEMDILWKVLNNLNQEDLNRVWYKNNLFEFCENSKVFNRIRKILKKLNRPLFNSLEIPEEIADDIKEFGDLLMEYVYYKYMIIDRVDKCDNMIKSVVMVLDTDSNIVSLDGWYRYVSEKISGEEFNIASYDIPLQIFDPLPDDTFNYDKLPARYKDSSIKDNWMQCVKNSNGSKYDYDFDTDEIVEMDHFNHPEVITGNDNMRYSIMNIIAYVLDRTVNDYMNQYCINNNSVYKDPNDSSRYYRKCRIISKNEFTFARLMMTVTKKNYASLQVVQEGNMVPENKQLDIKGIECLTKSSKSEKTREALSKILLEDIMKVPAIDQLKFIKDIAIFQKRIINSVESGSKEYFKPATVKAMNTYDNPMSQQGVKASVVWNGIKSSDYPAINLEERNAIDIAKVKINKANVVKIQEVFPEVYENCLRLLEDPNFKDGIDCIGIPLDTPTPDWIMDFIDYQEIVDNNIGGFPYESIGIKQINKNNVNWTNIVEL